MSKVRELAERDTGLGVPSSVDQSSSFSLIVCNNQKSRDRCSCENLVMFNWTCIAREYIQYRNRDRGEKSM
jgi:hypothetical protein